MKQTEETDKAGSLSGKLSSESIGQPRSAVGASATSKLVLAGLPKPHPAEHPGVCLDGFHGALVVRRDGDLRQHIALGGLDRDMRGTALSEE